jgi:hypothetical protein
MNSQPFAAQNRGGRNSGIRLERRLREKVKVVDRAAARGYDPPGRRSLSFPLLAGVWRVAGISAIIRANLASGLADAEPRLVPITFKIAMRRRREARDV